MIRPRKSHLWLAAAALIAAPSSCSSDTEALSNRLKKRNESYSNYNERRRLRLQARQERTDMWFDRVMGVE